MWQSSIHSLHISKVKAATSEYVAIIRPLIFGPCMVTTNDSFHCRAILQPDQHNNNNYIIITVGGTLIHAEYSFSYKGL